jgi:geranylgeranyl pyrophosphate synthase
LRAEPWRRELATEQRYATAALRRELAARRGIPARLRRAMAYSLLGGGKRLRPILVLWTFDALAATQPRRRRNAVGRETTARVAAAVEMLHTYSLIHDDLPAMDDDVLRRGRPTCHVVFDEATAILAGDGLQALAFEILATCGPRAADLVAAAAAAAGPAGMVGGQQRDLDGQGRQVTATMVQRIHEQKTAAMIAASLALGGICRDETSAIVQRLMAAGRWLGLAFQSADDVLDVTADHQQLGKTPGKDAASGKATWVRLSGVTEAEARARRQGQRGLRELAAVLPPGPHRHRLLALAGYMWQRRC